MSEGVAIRAETTASMASCSRKVATVAPLLGAGCAGSQSALDPAGPEATAVAELFWVMTGAGAPIWLAVVLAYLHARRSRRHIWSQEAAGRLILWAGVAFPVVTLLGLLSYGLWLMPTLRPWAAERVPGLVVEVTGQQFWWQIVYHPPDGAPVRSANELHCRPARASSSGLASPDVIHSFWIPALGGKMDMIPGRTNRLLLEADRPASCAAPAPSIAAPRMR